MKKYVKVDGKKYFINDLILYDYYDATFIAQIKYNAEDPNPRLYGEDIFLLKGDTLDYMNNDLDTWEIEAIIKNNKSITNFGDISLDEFITKFPEYFI